MNLNEFIHIIERYLLGKATRGEKKRLKELEQFALNKHKNSIFKSHDKKLKMKNTILNNVNRAIQKKTKRRLYFQRTAFLFLFVALIGYLYYTLQTGNDGHPKLAYITKKTNWGERCTFKLPDGTTVKLNSGSSLTYPEKFTGNTRAITLDGQAFFKVSKNLKKPFVITSNEFITTVLGTTFDLEAFSHNPETRITLKTGKVRVNIGKKEVDISPSEQLVYNKNNKQISLKKVEVQKYMEWKDGIIRFENTTFEEAIPKLEKWFGVSIKIEDKSISKYSFTGSFKDEKLRIILKQLCYVKQDIKFEYISDKQIIIKKK